MKTKSKRKVSSRNQKQKTEEKKINLEQRVILNKPQDHLEEIISFLTDLKDRPYLLSISYVNNKDIFETKCFRNEFQHFRYVHAIQGLIQLLKEDHLKETGKELGTIR